MDMLDDLPLYHREYFKVYPIQEHYDYLLEKYCNDIYLPLKR